jgi:menaquinone-dependent protoporphyrinogen oxidase
MRTRVLIAYGTNHGQTARIAQHMAEVLRQEQIEVVVSPVRHLGAVRLTDFDGAILGASITFGRHQREVSRFAQRHLATLDAMPSAFFSVCMAAANPEKAPEVRAYMDAFARVTGWYPGMTASIAGSISYTRYGFLTRWLVRRIVGSQGGPTDTSRDWERTDWAQVERFAHDFAARLGATGGAALRAAAIGNWQLADRDR